ncbi:MAG: 2-phospho-L-lactate guanylyltransferase [Betaproteobacteria bacterium]|nr:2-phospho-L-lactate guanylyltransferase [Betaproteobacteria bacterium]
MNNAGPRRAREHRGLCAVVPVKLFSRTKRRLSSLLSSHEREALARAMLQDVLSALASAPALAGIAVITGDALAAAIARAAGVLVVADTENAGTTAAVAAAARHLDGMGWEGMLVVPADVPLITPADIATIIAAHRIAPSVTLVPASADGGTNALACSPLRAVPFSFGEGSFRLHREAARARGIEPVILNLERVGHDIDRPSDLASFLRLPSPTRTSAYLTRIEVPKRLGHAHGDPRRAPRSEQVSQ